MRFIDPWGPYGRKKSEKITKSLDFYGGQSVEKSATYHVAKRVIFGKNMFFWTFLDFFENIVFQFISQSFMRRKKKIFIAIYP